ncbi:MAG: quinolinate synthase NadA [Spirochaetes bacterium]|nr:quinolinate synthase NadA [Spirochaetota bacterium]
MTNKGFSDLTKEELYSLIQKMKLDLKDKIIIPVHHYQSPEIVQFADIIGDSYKLAVNCSRSEKEFIIFCGVLFMAEGASILAKDEQKILIPEPTAGCPMAEMADLEQVKEAFDKIENITGKKTAPILYINSYADLKSFCGKKNGSVCTSSNAPKIIENFLKKGNVIFFLPDYYLGKNTAVKMNINDKKIVKIKKDLSFEKDKDCKNAKIFLWDGFCPIHQRFTVSDIKTLKEKYNDIKIIVHPESPEEVVKNSDFSGSTEKIFNMVLESKPGTVWGIGTETTFVSRLALENKDKTIVPLRESKCKNMMKNTPVNLAESLSSVIDYLNNNGKLKYEVEAKEEYRENAKKALDKMIEIVES